MSRDFTLGEHREVFLELLKLLERDVTTWEPGLLVTRRRSMRDTTALLGVGLLRLGHLAQMRNELRSRPELLDARGWVAKNVARTTTDYLLAPAFVEPRTYWRRSMSDTPLFMQTWLPIALVGGHRGPRAALLMGPIYSSVVFTLAAVLNQDVHFDAALRRRIGNYIVTGSLVGAFVAVVVRVLGAAERKASEVEDAAAALAAVQADADERRRLRAWLARSDLAALRVLEVAARRLDGLDPDERQALRAAQDQLRNLPVDGLEHGETLEALVDRAAAYAGVDVTWNKRVSRKLHERELEFLHGFLEVTFDNARRYAGRESVRISTTFDSHGMVAEVSGGCTPESQPAFVPGHGLADLRAHAQALGGNVTIDADGRIQTVLPHPSRHLSAGRSAP